MAVTRHRGRWTVEDRCASPCHYLPVPVPPGTAGLRVDAGLRPHRRRARPGLLRPGRVPRLVRRRPVGVRHHRRPGHARLPARRAGAGRMAGRARPVPAAQGRGQLHGDRGADQHAGPAAPRAIRGAAGPAQRAAAAPRTARPARPPLAGRRPAHAHRALRRGADRAGAGPAGHGARPGFPRGDRPQHGQPPRRAGRCRRPGTGSP